MSTYGEPETQPKLKSVDPPYGGTIATMAPKPGDDAHRVVRQQSSMRRVLLITLRVGLLVSAAVMAWKLLSL